MLKREVKRNSHKYGKLLEPLAIFFLLLLFTIPVLAVMNLSPQTGEKPKNDENVLGINIDPTEIIEDVGGTHEYITDEKLFSEGENLYRYQATILKRDAGLYTKPILSAQNVTGKNIVIKVSLVKDEASSAQLGLMIDNRNYVIKAENGEKFLRDFELSPGQEILFYLDIRNDEEQNFQETIELKIDILGLEEEIPEFLNEEGEELGVDTEILDEETIEEEVVEEEVVEEEFAEEESIEENALLEDDFEAPVGVEIDTHVFVNE